LVETLSVFIRVHPWLTFFIVRGGPEPWQLT